MSPQLTFENLKPVIEDPQRLSALKGTALLDTPPEEEFDRFTRLAVSLLKVSAAFVSLVDDKFVFFKSHSGVTASPADARQIPIESSFCPYAVAHGKLLLVSDARIDLQFRTHSAIQEFNLSAYAGVPLVTFDGYALGTFCVINAEPRNWTFDEIEVLTCLGAAVVSEIELRISVAQRLDNAARLEAALREADRRKDELLGMLAHELRNPLAPIRNAVQILNSRGATKAHLNSAREIVERQVAHMTRLIDDLVDAARLTQGKITLQKKKVDLATVISDAIEVARPIVIARGHTLKIYLPQELTPLYGDAVRLSQALSNILINAATYTPPGGTIQLSGVKTVSEISIHVRDNGAGIAPETLTHVFELFTQSERTLDRAQGGLGIGLALVKKLIEMHGGQVEAHSAGIDHGSEFVLRLPLAQEVFEACEPSDKLVVAKEKKSRRIMLVDDNEDSAQVTAILLKLEGHDVTVAHNGPAAIKQVNAVLPDVLLLDIGLPGMDGYELARKLRDLPETRNAIFIALTGYGQPEDRRNSENAGYDHHLVKPIEPTELIDLIAALG